ncbi:MAG: FAD-linked oxidase C-terminal domain-containing protein [Synergistaceae bacterium]|nr:FAD-linked oxidase C-terminal domain-containing protein [Synergistaceae bacterium]
MSGIFSYGKITDEIIDELKGKIGTNNVCADEEKLESYSRDEVPQSAYDREYRAALLVFPESTEHVSEVMKTASRERIPVTPRGAGTGLSGGALPAFGGIVMSFEKMNRILELDEANLTITTEPGVVTAEISRMAARHGLLYAGDPCSGDASFIGGNIAENAGGNKVIKYGATGAQLLALEVVLADGSVCWFGGKRRKDVTGLDFVHLMAGSEGVLAIITKAILRLMPAPRHSVDLLAAFPDAESAVAFVPQIIKEGGLIPASVEFIDRKALRLVASYLNTEIPAGDAGAALIIQLEENDAELLEREFEEIGKLSQSHGAYEVYVADTRGAKERIWQARKNVPEAVSAIYKRYTKEDLVVPTADVPALLELLNDTARSEGLECVAYGHVGDGNMHCTIISPECGDWHERLRAAQLRIYEKLVGMGGTLSGEHGIGYKRREYMKYFLDEAQLELIRRVKLAFDPQNILNPGKLVEWGE